MAFLDHTSRHIKILRTAPPQGLYVRGGKRLFDVMVCVALLPVVAVTILLLWLIAKTRAPTGLFAHPRVGKNGVVFRCWKIRTMIENADQALLEILENQPDMKSEWATTRKLSNDPRILPFGRFLRRTGLDELPQIWNVLQGDMSLVGPRPITRAELSLYGDGKADYLAIRPGITGLWQVTARRAPCYIRRVKLDRRYARHITFIGDLRILLSTLPVLFRPTGQ
jgi:exopolysaccharide production protein ExoY